MGHVMRIDESHIIRKMLSMKVIIIMKVDGRRRGRPKEIWMNCVTNDVCLKTVNTEMTAYRVEEKNLPYLGGVRVIQEKVIYFRLLTDDILITMVLCLRSSVLV